MKKLPKLSENRAKTFLLLVLIFIGGYIFATQKERISSLVSPQYTNSRVSSGETVSVQNLQKMLAKKNFTLINVHIPYEGELPQTDTFIAYDQIVANSESLPKDKNTPIILYCKSGRMSADAIQTLQKLGYTNVKHLSGGMDAWGKNKGKLLDLSKLEEEVLPANGIELPVSWNDLGPQLISQGVIDLAKFKKAVKLTPEQEKILTDGSPEKIKITKENSQFIVDVLWGVGLAQKSLVYDEGPLGKEEKKNSGNFASTGGWTLGQGDALQYLNKFDFLKLTPDQQKKTGEIAKNVYRPCCGNSTWFPDCNHGMAALAAIELMVAANIDEKEIYRNVLALNSYWFGETYLTIATSFARQGIAWKDVDVKMVLGEKYSSGRGAAEINKQVGPLPYRRQESGGGCSA